MSKRPPKVRKITAEDTTEDVMLKLVAWYLESKGWTVAVISASRIQGPVDAPCNFELVFRFTGAKQEKPCEADARRIVDAVNATLRSVGPHRWSTTSSFCQVCGVLRTPYVENLACPGPGAPA